MDREKVIKGLELCGYMEGMPQCDLCPYDGKQCWKRLKNDALALLKEKEDIKEQFIEAFNTIRDAYNTPANREKILLDYLLRNACCCKKTTDMPTMQSAT